MNIQEENSARYFRVQSEREQTFNNEGEKSEEWSSHVSGCTANFLRVMLIQKLAPVNFVNYDLNMLI